MKRLFRNAVVCAVALVGLASPTAASETITYTYDALGRLITLHSTGGPADGQAVSTVYDAAGNRTTQTVTGSGGSQAQLSIGDANVVEAETLNFTVTRSGDMSGAVSAHYSTANVTAVAPGDYTAQLNGTVNFAINQATATISVPTADDNTIESAETMTVTLSSPSSGATITNATGTGTINDNDSPTVAFSIADATAAEGNNLSFTVTVGAHTGSVSVTASTSDGTATAPGDYTAKSQTLTFTSAQTSKTFSVVTTEDSVSEATETMNVTLSSPSNDTTIADGSAVGTITDDDAVPSADLTIGNASGTEGGTLSFTVTRSGTTTTAVSAHYATTGGTAISGSDFTAKSGTVSFAANQTAATITVATTDDSATEAAETMTVTLSSPSSGATITTATGTGTINDNDGNIILTTTGAPYYMAVLSQYSSVYGCQGGSPMGNTYEVCFVIGIGQVYNSAGSPTFAAGYSLTANGELQVDAAHYGTAQ